jgi:hypothetical protein
MGLLKAGGAAAGKGAMTGAGTMAATQAATPKVTTTTPGQLQQLQMPDLQSLIASMKMGGQI